MPASSSRSSPSPVDSPYTSAGRPSRSAVADPCTPLRYTGVTPFTSSQSVMHAANSGASSGDTGTSLTSASASRSASA